MTYDSVALSVDFFSFIRIAKIRAVQYCNTLRFFEVLSFSRSKTLKTPRHM